MKRRTKVALWSVGAFLFVASGLMASIAWFESGKSEVKVAVTGSVVQQYFHCGTGTQSDPFVITRPIHYYHLVEFFQRKTNLPTSLTSSVDFGTDYLYFQVGYKLKENDNQLYVYRYDDQGLYEGTDSSPEYSTTLNMAYYSGSNALMPIGTNEVPFIGSFNGNAPRITIANLNIRCAERVQLEDGTYANRAASDVGIFGYVADEDSGHTRTVIQNAYFDGLTIDLTDVATTVAASATNVSHTSTHSGEAYVGLVAGHVHSYTNYSSTGPTNATPLSNVYVSNGTVQGGAGVRCGYGYIGKVDNLDGENPASVPGEVTELINNAGGQGQGNDWGGSIAFDAFNQRLRHQVVNGSSVRFANGGTTYSTGLIKSYTDTYSSMSLFRGGGASTAETYLSKDPATNYVVYNMIGSGTHQINGNSSGKSTTYTANSSVNGTYEPLLIESDYSISDKNTGYLVSSNYAYGSGHYSAVDGTVRSASYPNGQIGNSIDDTYHDLASLFNSSTGGPKYTYNGAKLEILTNSSATYSTSNYRLISDDYNSNHTVSNSALTGYTKTNYVTLGLTRYKSARDHLESILTNSQYVHGIHFMGETANKSNTIQVPNAVINGESKTNYPVLLSSIDFNVKEAGYITLFAGAYYPASSTTSADSFFDLYVVNRSANDSISSIQKIYKIYKNTSTGAYTYTSSANQTVTNATLMFDMSYLTNKPPKNNVAYYFEIPVDAGEFAISAVSGKTAGAYLMYLDIGVSGTEETPTANQTNKIDNVPLFTQIDFQTDSFVINSCFNVAYVIPTGATKETFTITVSCGTDTYEDSGGGSGEQGSGSGSLSSSSGSGSASSSSGSSEPVEYTCYDIVITNTSGNAFTISCLLMDDDNDATSAYTYMYAITYNGGDRVQYLSSGTYVGASSGTAMNPPSSSQQSQSSAASS